MKDKKLKKQSICPISGLPKRRRHAVAASVWAKATDGQRMNWAAAQVEYLKRKRPAITAGGKPTYMGSLRRFRA